MEAKCLFSFITKYRWCFLLVLFLGLLNFLTESIPINFPRLHYDTEDTFSVLCYNVKCTSENYGDNQIAIAKEIISESPDLVFLCEYARSTNYMLDSLMKTDGHYTQYYRSGANSVFFSKIKIDSIISIDTGISAGRNALNNKIHMSFHNETITVVGCHLSSSRRNFYEGWCRRHREADSIRKSLDGEAKPIIVMGDMNDISGSITINQIKKAGLKDAWWEGGCGYGATYHDGWLRLRVDHILYDCDGLDLVDLKVIDNDLSDHNALMATFKIKKKHL